MPFSACLACSVLCRGPVPPLWYSLDREYGHWRLYIKCLNWYDTWLTQHGTQPKRPTFHPSHFQNATHAKAEYHQFAQKYERYAKEMDNWKKEQRSEERRKQAESR